MKNTIEKSDDENVTENTLQCIDNECVNGGLQASFKQNFIREEKNRGEKKNNNNKEIPITIATNNQNGLRQQKREHIRTGQDRCNGCVVGNQNLSSIKFLKSII